MSRFSWVETVKKDGGPPYYLSLCFAMSDATRTLLAMGLTGKPPASSDKFNLLKAAAYLDPKTTKSITNKTEASTSLSRLLNDGREAFCIPETEPQETVETLLGHSAVVLMDIAGGVSIDKADIDFARMATISMRDVAADRRQAVS